MARYKDDGHSCAIPWHSHAPRDCPGRARIVCAVCGKALIKHESFGFCTDGDEGKMNPQYLIDEIGRRRKRRDT